MKKNVLFTMLVILLLFSCDTGNNNDLDLEDDNDLNDVTILGTWQCAYYDEVNDYAIMTITSDNKIELSVIEADLFFDGSWNDNESIIYNMDSEPYIFTYSLSSDGNPFTLIGESLGHVGGPNWTRIE